MDDSGIESFSNSMSFIYLNPYAIFINETYFNSLSAIINLA